MFNFIFINLNLFIFALTPTAIMRIGKSFVTTDSDATLTPFIIPPKIIEFNPFEM